MTDGGAPSRPRESSWLRGALLYGPPLLLAAWPYGRILRRMTESGDYPAHIRFAQDIAQTGRITIPHFGYELGVLAAHAVRPDAGWASAAFLVSLAGQLAAVLLLARWAAASVPDSRPWLRAAAALLLPVVLLIVQPALPPGPMARDPWLIGYFPPNQFHNPTTLLSKPLALALVGFGVAAAFGARPLPGRIAACAALVVASGLVKPSFLMAFLPAVGVAALWNWRRARWNAIVFGLAVPAVLLLSAQFLLRYRLQAADGVSIVLDPLMVIGLYGPTDPFTLAAKLVASVLFPLAVTVLFVRGAVRDHGMVLAWATLAVGVSYGYLLAEAGGKASAGDFLWSGQLAVFLLFAVSAMFLLRQVSAAPAHAWRVGAIAKAGLCVLILTWHVTSGVQHLQTSWFD